MAFISTPATMLVTITNEPSATETKKTKLKVY